MHELSLAQSILDVVRESVPARDLPAVRAVRLRVGALAGVVVDSLRFCFDALVQETALAAAGLEVEPVPARIACGPCAATHVLEGLAQRCPSCHGIDIRRVSGHELDVVAIELVELVEPLSEVP